MRTPDVPRAKAAATSIASELGLIVEGVSVLQDANRLALRLLPCDVLARVAHDAHVQNVQFELAVARRLAATESPVALLEPRVDPRIYARDGFAVTLWEYYEPVPPSDLAPTDYASALERLHAGMRRIDFPAPHFTDRVAEAQTIASSRELAPELTDEDRELLSDTLRDVAQAIVARGAPEQLLHGEPHPGNLLSTKHGPLFIDLETCCHGPVEFDVAHAPEEVGEHYPGVDRELLRECRLLSRALVTAWRWHRDDRFPNRDEWRQSLLGELRAART